MSKTRDILELYVSGRSARSISKQLGVSRNTVARVLKAVERHPVDPSDLTGMTEAEVKRVLYPEKYADACCAEPDFAHVHDELRKVGTTLKLLWQEYSVQCDESGVRGYKYSRFHELYTQWTSKRKLTAPIQHKPAELVMVDWAGKTLHLPGQPNKKTTPVYLFVAVLPFSMYTFACACSTMKESDWLGAHAAMYEYFGGVTRILVCDNTKTAVISNRKSEEPVLNRSYAEMADHYATTIIPTRVYRPKDKAAVESTVNCLTTQIIGGLRNTFFPDLVSMNAAIRRILDTFNAQPFQKREGSRLSVFLEEEQPFLSKLPALPFAPSTWSTAVVQVNCHICVQKHNYSVPYQYVGKTVDVRRGAGQVRVYFEGELLCTHAEAAYRGGYTTTEEHMPPGHRLMSWDGDRFRAWASRKHGPFTREIVDRILLSRKAEQQAYKTLFAVLNLPKKYPRAQLEDVCQELLCTSGKAPTLTQIETIMKTYDAAARSDAGTVSNSFTRGSAYYASKVNGETKA